ncbi:alpha/beta hydrolase [Ornithinibacillus halotolerans]|uniref:Alpha/beta hydrolase n=1 Tax=Ornithinibacillus halotolerans TaxID=1274357 RepID=A0A916RQV2_9BACI|nr:alpha/beta hydrolase [Ornithinibacillus halotolerans]GGA65972.1 alpha/beta hydrolase [Ornithinibacillus halotolerans]
MKQTVIYKTVDQCDIKGDFYPSDKKDAPVIIYIHGGGLIWGSREDMREEQINFFNSSGYHVFTIDYRLAPETKIDGIKEDVEDAINWLKTKGSETFQINVNKIVVMGSSAGGYLALLTGLMNHKPDAIVSLYGYGDITGSWYTRPSSFFLQKPNVPKQLAYQLVQPKPLSVGPIQRRYAIYLYCRQQGAWLDEATGMNPITQLDKIKTYCPYYQLDHTYPPTMLLHGNKDTDVPYEESVKMNEKLTEHQVIHDFITMDNADHVFDEHWDDPNVKQAFQRIIEFIDEHVQ